MQACYRNNVPCDLFQREELDRLDRYSVVVLNEGAIVSDSELRAFRSFVERGGTLIWTGGTGTRDGRGVPRPEDALRRAWGLSEPLCGGDGQTTVSHRVGQGQLILVAGDLGLGPFEPEHVADRWQKEEARVPFRAVPGEEKEQWKRITDLLTGYLPGEPDFVIENLPEDAIVTAYQSADDSTLVLHLVNAAGTLDVPSGALVGHSDPIPFPGHEGTVPIRLCVRKPPDLRPTL